MKGIAASNSTFIQRMNQLGADKIPFSFLIDFECKKPRLWKAGEKQDEFLYFFNGKQNQQLPASIAKYPPELNEKKIILDKFPLPLEAYRKKFEKTSRHITRGDSYLVNLTMATPIALNVDMDLLYQRVFSKYKCRLKNEFVCFSPECFVQIRDGHIYSFPMKGTIDASIPHAEMIIQNDTKEAAEHATIVDLIRNDLSRIATNVSVSRYRYYEVIKTHDKDLGQISSEIKGTLPADYASRIGDIIFSLLPAGSVSGAPKKKTLDIIRSVEESERGYYTGVAGHFDGNDLDSCVLIRYIEKNSLYRSGGGITSKSDIHSEYQELIDKVYVPVH